MNTKRMTVILAATALCASVGYAQTPTPSPSSTSPSSASSPSQREATQSTATESSSTTSGTDPANASTPAQRDALKQQKMKDCMAQQSASNAAMSTSDMTKACDEKMKMHKDHTGMAKAPSDAPKNSQIGTADAPK